MNRSNVIAFALAMGLTAPVSAQEAGAAKPEVGVESPAKPEVKPPEQETPQQSVQQRVEFLLSGYEYFPTRKDLDQVADAAQISVILRGLANDATGRPSMRLRAVDALGYYDDEATVTLLTKLVSEEPADGLTRRKARTANLMRHHAITALVRSQRGNSVPTLEPVLAGDDLQLTLTAVHALGKHGSAAGREALATLRESTTNKTLQRELAKWLK